MPHNLEYLKTPRPDNEGEMLNVETARWVVRGPHRGVHTFHFIRCAEVVNWGIHVQSIIRHHHEGDYRDDIKWGPDSTYAYTSSAWEMDARGVVTFGLLGRKVILNELPCCGGKFHGIKESRSDYGASVSYGECLSCGKRWTLADCELAPTSAGMAAIVSQ